jgi:sulfhydrogenase subunit beta (sulfur reductase)
MANQTFYVKNDAWRGFLRQLAAEYNLYAPTGEWAEIEYQICAPESLSDIVYPRARLITPLKYFFYPPRERVSTPKESTKKNVLLGIKDCDLRANKTLDKIYLDPDYVDPFYKDKRDNTFIISSDCNEPYEVCFCSLMGGNPYPEEGFDLNISLLDGGVLVEIGSDKGKALIERHKLSGTPAGKAELSKRQQIRDKAIEIIKEKNKDFDIPGPSDIVDAVEKKYDSEVWDEMAKTCVACGACTNICPSCHCFLLAETSPDRLEKERLWDSCQYTGYARVAGGANPRPKIYERFRNRFYCKLFMKPKNYDFLACTACGRCIAACQGKIDIRELYTKLGKR